MVFVTGGPSDRRQLARFLNHEPEYLALYGDWSDIAHATDATVYLIGSDKEGNEAALRPVRFAATLPQRAFLSASFILPGIRLMLQHDRRDEPGLSRWYLREVKARYQRLQDLRVETG